MFFNSRTNERSCSQHRPSLVNGSPLHQPALGLMLVSPNENVLVSHTIETAWCEPSPFEGDKEKRLTTS